MSCGCRLAPPTAVKTKFDVNGELLFPKKLVYDLKAYAMSARRLTREIRASEEDKTILFLTRTGRKFTENSFTSRIAKLRARLIESGWPEYSRLKFHQTRATFGTRLVSKLLGQGEDQRTVIRFVRDAMLHRSEKSTWDYITFVEFSPLKETLSDRYFAFFSGQGDSPKADEVIDD